MATDRGITPRKENRKYTFTVEGETEQWYLNWLMERINESLDAKYTVSITAKVQQSPKKHAKTVNPMSTPSITHICDYESNDPAHVEKFQRILSELKEANSIKGKKLTYSLGYSNFTFELWMILHLKSCNGTLTNRTQYLSFINSAYGEKFENLDQYKHERNFKRCLSKLTLDHVRSAIERSRCIMSVNQQNGMKPVEYKGFTYYTENPSLTIWEPVAGILSDCGLL